MNTVPDVRGGRRAALLRSIRTHFARAFVRTRLHERPLVRARAFIPLWKHPECHNMATRCAIQGPGIQCLPCVTLPAGSARRGNVLPTSVSILRSERENERATWPWVRADRQVDGWVEGRASGRAGGRAGVQ
jgi:hypothetical protein